MELDFSSIHHTPEENEMINYLMNDFCCDAYERDEMMKWIGQKSVRYVYNMIRSLFTLKNQA